MTAMLAHRYIRYIGLPLISILGLALLYFIFVKQRVARMTDVEADIYETVFRYEFDHSGEGVRTVGGFHLLVNKKDPPDAFMTRFRGNVPPVKQGSEYSPGSGIRFAVSEIRWIDDRTVKVYITSYTSSRRFPYFPFPVRAAESGNVYYLRNTNGHWRVEKVENLYMT